MVARTRAQRRCSLFAFQGTIKKAICSCHSCFIVFLSGALTLGDRIKPLPRPTTTTTLPSPSPLRPPLPPHHHLTPLTCARKKKTHTHMRSGSVYTSSAADKHSHAQHVGLFFFLPPSSYTPTTTPDTPTPHIQPRYGCKTKKELKDFFFFSPLFFAFWITGSKKKKTTGRKDAEEGE